MQLLLQLLKSKTVVFAIILAALSVVQGYVGLLPLTPILDHEQYTRSAG